MGREIWRDGVLRPHQRTLSLVFNGLVYVIDRTVLLRCEPAPGGTSRKNVGIYAPDDLSVQTEREWSSFRSRVGDPSKIGLRALNMSDILGKDVVFIGREKYGVSFEGRFTGGLNVSFASPDEMLIEEYPNPDPAYDKTRQKVKDFLLKLREDAHPSNS